jgi:alpha-beta hydrolase superfamily lysophospholipase
VADHTNNVQASPHARAADATETAAMSPESKPTIVLIHGLWVNALSWEHWAERYRARGHEVIARGWPGMEGDIEALRADPSGIDDVGIADVIDHYQGVIEALAEPPIVMGHSFGGAFVQVLLDRGLGAAGVGIDASAVKGVTKLPLSTLRATSSGLGNPRNRHRAIAMTADEFHYAFTNTLDDEAAAQAYARYAAPGPGKVLWEGALANLTRHSPLTVDFDRADRAPLLLIAGGADHVVPASVDTQTFNKYDNDSGSVVEYKEFPGRSHFTIGQPGWEEVADYALDWAVAQVSGAGAGRSLA